MGADEYVFTDEHVEFVSSLLQGHMARNRIAQMTADECAELLDASSLLTVSDHPKQGFRFRQMLRDGRDGKIGLVHGASQDRPNTRWTIRRMI